MKKREMYLREYLLILLDPKRFGKVGFMLIRRRIFSGILE